MSAPVLAPTVGAIGPTAFAVLTWGSVGLVVLAFVYVVFTLVQTRRRSGPGRVRG